MLNVLSKGSNLFTKQTSVSVLAGMFHILQKYDESLVPPPIMCFYSERKNSSIFGVIRNGQEL